MADWFVLTLLAAFFLGLYDVAKKHAVTDNAVAPVLFANVSTAALIWGIGICFDVLNHGRQSELVSLEVSQQLLLLAKSAMVGVSWMLAFVALKYLPISIAAPVRATSPLWTIFLAVSFTGERPTAMQWLGVGLILLAFFAFSLIGKKEGIEFKRNRAIWLMVAATLVSSFCGLYDKYLLQQCGIEPRLVQAWFSIYLVPVMVPMALWWFVHSRRSNPFQWRWSIPMIAILLLVADYLYFVAVSDPEALISVISPLRRCSVAIPFLFGIVLLKEKSWATKLACIAILLLGAFLVSFA